MCGKGVIIDWLVFVSLYQNAGNNSKVSKMEVGGGSSSIIYLVMLLVLLASMSVLSLALEWSGIVSFVFASSTAVLGGVMALGAMRRDGSDYMKSSDVVNKVGPQVGVDRNTVDREEEQGKFTSEVTESRQKLPSTGRDF